MKFAVYSRIRYSDIEAMAPLEEDRMPYRMQADMIKVYYTTFTVIVW